MTLHSLHTTWRAALDRFRRQRRLRQDEQALRDLSDHVLCDMGIGRSEICAVIRAGRPSTHMKTSNPPWPHY